MMIWSLNYDSIWLNFAIIFLSNYFLLNYKCISFLYRCWVMVCTCTQKKKKKKNTEKENQKKKTKRKKMICLNFICMIGLNIFNILGFSIFQYWACTWWRLFQHVPDEGYSRSMSCTLNLICTFLLKNNFTLGTNHLTFKGVGGYIYIVSPRDGIILFMWNKNHIISLGGKKCLNF